MKTSIIYVPVKLKTILACQKTYQHPIERALNLHFGLPLDYQLVFLVVVWHNLRTEITRAHLRIWGPGCKSNDPVVVEFDSDTTRKCHLYVKNKRIVPFVFHLSVTEKILQRIKDAQYNRRVTPTNKGIPSTLTYESRRDNPSATKSRRKASKRKGNRLGIGRPPNTLAWPDE